MPRIAMIGAGSVVFARQLVVDILAFPELAGSTFALMDIDAARLDTARRMVLSSIAATGVEARVESHLERRPALDGADYVINMVQVGGHAATLLDFDIPRRYGLKQTIADTLGVGGVFRALRTIPVLLDLCRDMEAQCPGALLLNYTNPMAMLCLAVARAGRVPFVGLCHSVQGTSRQLARYVGVDYDRVRYRVAGINHMAWFLDFTVDRQDAYPRLWDLLERGDVPPHDRVRFEMMRRLGYFVTESSEHMAEYLPYFLKRDALIERFNIPVDEYVRRSEANLAAFEQARVSASGQGARAVTPSHEYAASIIRAIETDSDWSFHGNVANAGLIDNLPADACVEVPCLVNANGVQPVVVGALPPQLAALNRTNINVQQLTVEAAVTGNRDHVYQAVMLDPHAAAVLSLDEIWAMTDDLIQAHGAALPALTPGRLRPRRTTTTGAHP
ncbi:MAG: alpha-glucosidase/alpha-galactosidase [Chloroflexi bacterium]|nr:alpha-glucosidase/alpha-galactosidase [Chloroflexota bacterium]